MTMTSLVEFIVPRTCKTIKNDLLCFEKKRTKICYKLKVYYSLYLGEANLQKSRLNLRGKKNFQKEGLVLKG